VGKRANTEFEFIGFNHLAPVCRFMHEAVDFDRALLGCP
jgi:hypothetical protein